MQVKLLSFNSYCMWFVTGVKGALDAKIQSYF